MQRVCEATLRIRCGSGRAHSIQVHAGATASQGRGIVLSLIDVTPRVEVAEQLQVVEASLRGLLDAVPQPAFVVAGGEVVANNDAASDLVGDNPLGSPLSKFVGRGQQAALRCCLDTDWVAGSVQRLDVVFASEGPRPVAAETLWLAFSFEGRRATLCLVLTDSAAAIRESREDAREQLEAIAGAASSLGHSLNNALTCLGMTVGELAERVIGGPDEVCDADADELLDAVTEGLERLGGGVRGLQSIVRLCRGADSRPRVQSMHRAQRATRELLPAGGMAPGGSDARLQEVSPPVTRELPPIGEQELVLPQEVDKVVLAR